MKGQAISFMYVLNIVMQSLFSLVFNVALFFGIGFLLTEVFSVERWVYVPLLIVGFFIGIVSMIKFILVAMAGLERLERQRDKK